MYYVMRASAPSLHRESTDSLIIYLCFDYMLCPKREMFCYSHKCVPCLQIAVHFKGDDKEAFREVIQRIYIPKKTTWRDIAHLCKRAGYDDHSTALLDAGLITVFPFNYLSLLFIIL